MTHTQPRLAPLTPDTARGAARDLLTELVARHCQVGPMVRTMAHSPAVLGGYLGLSRAMKRAKLDRRVSERISLAIQQHQDCAVCLAAHADAARAVGVAEDEIERARHGDGFPDVTGEDRDRGVRRVRRPMGEDELGSGPSPAVVFAAYLAAARGLDAPLADLVSPPADEHGAGGRGDVRNSSGATKSNTQSIAWPGPTMKPSSDMDLFTTTLPSPVLVFRTVLLRRTFAGCHPGL